MLVFYFNEIEKGKKFLKVDKIMVLVNIFGVDQEELFSIEMGVNLVLVKELLEFNFFNEFLFDLFGIELGKVVEIIVNVLLCVGVFIFILLEFFCFYVLREENFFFVVLWVYLEFNNNYFEYIEEVVKIFVKEYKILISCLFFLQFLFIILEDNYDYEVIKDGLDVYFEMEGLCLVFLFGEK